MPGLRGIFFLTSSAQVSRDFPFCFAGLCKAVNGILKVGNRGPGGFAPPHGFVT